jgi:hypothetical protein
MKVMVLEVATATVLQCWSSVTNIPALLRILEDRFDSRPVILIEGIQGLKTHRITLKKFMPVSRLICFNSSFLNPPESTLCKMYIVDRISFINVQLVLRSLNVKATLDPYYIGLEIAK